MKYTIEGFSQSEALKLKKTDEDGKTICLDCTDLVILRWFVDFFPHMTKVVVDGIQYAWVDYKYLLDDMPLLGIKKRMLALRLRKMADLGILSHKTIKAGGTYSYYTFGENYFRLVKDCTAVKNIDEGVDNKFTNPSQNIDEGVGNKLTNKDSSTINPSTNPSISMSIGQSHAPKEKAKDKPKKETESIPPTVEEVRKYCEERQNGIDAQYFVDYYEARGWKYSRGVPVKSWKACIRTWERKSTTYDKPSKNNHTSKRDEIPDYEKDAIYTEDGELDLQAMASNFWGK